VELGSDEEVKKVLTSGDPLVIDFTAKWCGPCKMIAPEYEKMSNEYDKVKFYKVDVDNPQTQATSADNAISSVPTFLFYKDGKQVQRLSGADRQGLRSILQSL
jgi:thioredoxin